MKERRKTRQILVGAVPVGGDAPLAVQSMTKTDTRDTASTIAQIRALAGAGCEIVRLAVLDQDAALALGPIKEASPVPLIADIHFDWKLALTAVERGVDGLRINPGNIGATWKVKELVAACKDKGIPIRIGVNAGSLQKNILKKYGHPCPEAVVESAQRHIAILEELDFQNIKVSLKTSSVLTTVESYRIFSKNHDYPLHIGISEAGPAFGGTIKSSVGLGILLGEGIGDTMRVSLTADPVEEVRVAYEILRALEIRQRGINLISCPTCGRTRVDLRSIVSQAQERFREMDTPITIAIMGCEVNGPGEAREAHYGIASGKGEGLLFKKGEVVGRVAEAGMLDALVQLIAEDRHRDAGQEPYNK